MASTDVTVHMVSTPYPPQVAQTWYRWVTPDGEIWCESRNVNEIPPKRAKRLKLRLYAQVEYRVFGAWREVTDAPLPDA